MNSKYINLAYCESIHASSISPWCLRLLGPKGKFLGGGVDSSSLCGRVKKGMGWDLEVDPDGDVLRHPKVCGSCAAIWHDADLNTRHADEE